MDLRKEYHTATFYDVSRFVKTLTSLETDPVLQETIENAPEALVKGRTLREIAIDDTLTAFETIMKDVPEEDIPLSFYTQLLRARDGAHITDGESQARLQQNIEARSTAGTMPESATNLLLDDVPDFMKLILNDAPVNTIKAVAEEWTSLLQSFGQLTMDHDALSARRTSIALANDMVSQINKTLQEQMDKNKGAGSKRQKAPKAAGGGNASDEQKLDMLLETFGDDLTALAEDGDLPEYIAREEETTQLMAAMLQKDTPHALSVGPSGAGKSALTEALAQRIVDGDVPEKLKDARVIRLNLKDMKARSGNAQIADEKTGEASIVDQFSWRLHFILREVAAQNSLGGQQTILNIPELGDMAERILPTLQGKGALSSVMKGNDDLRLIAEIEDQKYNVMEKEAKDFLGLFHKVNVEPLGREDTVAVLRQEAKELADVNNVITPEPLLEKIEKMSSRHTPGKAQPAAALAVLKAAAAYAEVKGAKELESDHIVTVVSKLSNLPKEFIGSDVSDRIATLGEELPKKVVGQPSIEKIVSKLRIANANLKNPNKPLGSFMMIGPTGVGKTETAKALAEHLGVPLITEDMSNYTDQHAKAKLVGAPPGYVGFDQEAALEKVAKSPYCVLLLDEIEKAHKDVFNLLLSVLDEGRMQLMNGKTVDFKNTVILMSSNLGARNAAEARSKRSIGFNTEARDNDKAAGDAYMSTVKQELPPEFIGRIDGILQYDSLNKEAIRKIAIKKVEDVSAFLQDQNQNLSLKLTPKAMEELVSLGFDPDYGARPMEKAVEDYIKDPLADWLIANFHKVSEPTTLEVKQIKGKFDMKPRIKRRLGPDGLGPAA